MSAQWRLLEPLVHLDENVTVLFIIHTLMLSYAEKKYSFVVSPDDTIEAVLQLLFKICAQKITSDSPLHYTDIDHIQLPSGVKLRPHQFRTPILVYIGHDDAIVVRMRFSWQRELAEGFAYFMVFFVVAAVVLFAVMQILRLVS